MVTSADATMYKYRDETFPPLTPFEVKVGVYNNKGDGPFSKVVIIHSAEGGALIFRTSFAAENVLFVTQSSLYALPHRAKRSTSWRKSIQHFFLRNSGDLETTKSCSWKTQRIWGIYAYFYFCTTVTLLFLSWISSNVFKNIFISSSFPLTAQLLEGIWAGRVWKQTTYSKKRNFRGPDRPWRKQRLSHHSKRLQQHRPGSCHCSCHSQDENVSWVQHAATKLASWWSTQNARYLWWVHGIL